MPFGLTVGADYVALIIPHQGELVVEATFAASNKDALTSRCVNGNIEFHDKEPLADGLLVNIRGFSQIYRIGSEQHMLLLRYISSRFFSTNYYV